MRKVYLCWQCDNSILGIASSKKEAMRMCTNIGDSFMPVELNVPERNSIDSTPLCIFCTQFGFLSYEECLKKGYTFKGSEKDEQD